MSDGRLVKMEVDYSTLVEQVLPECQEMVKVKKDILSDWKLIRCRMETSKKLLKNFYQWKSRLVQ